MKCLAGVLVQTELAVVERRQIAYVTCDRIDQCFACFGVVAVDSITRLPPADGSEGAKQANYQSAVTVCEKCKQR